MNVPYREHMQTEVETMCFHSNQNFIPLLKFTQIITQIEDNMSVKTQ